MQFDGLLAIICLFPNAISVHATSPFTLAYPEPHWTQAPHTILNTSVIYYFMTWAYITKASTDSSLLVLSLLT
jgi:hypothetical protein